MKCAASKAKRHFLARGALRSGSAARTASSGGASDIPPPRRMRRPAQRQAAALAAVLCASVLALKSTTTVAVRVTPDAGLSGAAGIDAAAAAAASAANSYKPVFLMHGVTGSGSDLAQNVQWIQEAHPGQVAVTLEIYDAVKSFAPLPLQVQNIAHKIRTLAQQYNCSESGYHLVGHSQVCRPRSATRTATKQREH